MHQPHAEPRRSIYYRYQVHAPWLASAHPPQDRKKVVIVGAGPIGLFAALELARLGVPCVLLESELQVSEGSRAIVFTRRSMEILQQVGVDAPITANGLPWRFGNSFYRGQRVYRMEAPHDPDDRFFPMINLQQQYLEQYLTEAVLAHPLIEMRWGNRVTRVDPKDSFVRVDVDTPEGPYSLESDWLVAADGARSGIRSDDGPEARRRLVRGPLRHCRHPHRPAAAHRAPGLLRPRLEPRQHHPDAPRAARHLARGLPAAGRRDARAGARPRIAQGAHRRPAGDDRPRRHALGDGLVLGLLGPCPDAARLRARPRAVHRRRGAHAADLRRARRQHRLAGRAVPGLAPGLRGKRVAPGRRCCRATAASAWPRPARSSTRRERAPAS
jgi:2-polyprenyl-6-methoxyphenol hydroxylase-like FAD-dependent oxidoreductase